MFGLYKEKIKLCLLYVGAGAGEFPPLKIMQTK